MKFFKKESTEAKKESTEEKEDEKVISEEAPLEQKNEKQAKESTQKKGWFAFKSGEEDKQKEKSQKSETISDERPTIENFVAEKPKVSVKNTGVLENSQKLQTTVHVGMEAGEDEQIKKIIDILTNSKETSVTPYINFEENLFTYPLLESLGTYEYVISVLDSLSSPSINILEKGIYEKLPVCPEHSQSFTTSLRLYCPTCSSIDVAKLHLVEHKACGYITEKKDLNLSEMTKCISCKNTIKDPEKEIRKLGRWYECNKCKARFDNCVVKFHCRKFNHDFDINQANTISVPQYTLKSDSKSLQFYSLSIIPQIKRDLESKGFIVEESSEVRGKSGIAHKVSIFGRKEQQTILIDIKTSDKVVEDTEVNSMIMKVLDVSPSLSIFIGMPAVSETAKNVASKNNISIITGANTQEILSSIKNFLGSQSFAT